MPGKLPNKFKCHQRLDNSLDNTFSCTGDPKGEGEGSAPIGMLIENDAL